jgi:hypothetical protein
MLSSLNAFGGLSAANLLLLFSTNSSSASSSATSANDAKSASTHANNSADAIKTILAQAQSAASNPANAIKAILAQAQIDQAQTATLGGASATTSSNALVSASATISSPNSIQQIAEQIQTETSGGQSTSVIAALATSAVKTAGSSTLASASAIVSQDFVRLNQAETETSAGSTISTHSEAVQMLGVSSLTSGVSVSLTATSDATSGAIVDNFELALSVGSQSVAVRFSVAGLGQVEGAPGGGSAISVGQGPLMDFFQLDMASDGYAGGVAFNIEGLDATQAQQVAAAFEAATFAPSNIGTAINTGGRYTEDYAPGVSVVVQEATGYQ